MNYEQKYKWALEKARVMHDSAKKLKCEVDAKNLEHIFPELKESEDEDERIRKAILTGLIDCRDAPDLMWSNFGGINIDECITWFEKQGEQKQTWSPSAAQLIVIKDLIEDKNTSKVNKIILRGMLKEIEDVCPHVIEKQDESPITNIEIPFGASDSELQEVDYYIPKGFHAEVKDDRVVIKKVEPKFKVGNWYQCTKDFFGKGVTFDKNTAYYCAEEGCLQNEYGCHIAIVEDLYDNFKLWTIQDAKDGDVLVNGSNIFIFHFLDDTRLKGYCHVNIDDGRFYDDIGKKECFCLIDAVVTPAAKEQRDLLFQKMAEEGYEWNTEKKEVKKIEPNFKVGDWIIGDEGIFKISQYEDDGGYNLTDTTGCVIHFVSPDYVESNYHLWTIQDAKDGDMLVDDEGRIAVFEE